MRLAIGSYAYAWSIGVGGHMPSRPMTVVDLVETAAAMGVEVVQICDNLPLETFTERQIDELAQCARQRNVEIEVGTRGISLEHIGRCLALAGRVRSAILRVVIDTAEHRPAVDEVVATVKRVLPELEEKGVLLAIENHDRFSVRQFVEILERVSSPLVGICLDTVNSFGALEGPEVVVAALAPWTISLHVKDFWIRRADHQMGFTIEGRPAGEGRLDIPWLLRSVHAAGHDPNAVLEQWPPPEATLEETIAKEHRWAEASVRYLRTLVSD